MIIKKQWENYFKLTFKGGNYGTGFSDIQIDECRKVFYAAYGSALIYFRNDLVELSEGESVKILQNMVDEVERFFEDEVKKYNKNG